MGVRPSNLPDLLTLLCSSSSRGSVLQIGALSLLMSPRDLLQKLEGHGLCITHGDRVEFRDNHTAIADLFRSQRHVLQEGLRGQAMTRSDIL